VFYLITAACGTFGKSHTVREASIDAFVPSVVIVVC